MCWCQCRVKSLSTEAHKDFFALISQVVLPCLASPHRRRAHCRRAVGAVGAGRSRSRRCCRRSVRGARDIRVSRGAVGSGGPGPRSNRVSHRAASRRHPSRSRLGRGRVGAGRSRQSGHRATRGPRRRCIRVSRERPRQTGLARAASESVSARSGQAGPTRAVPESVTSWSRRACAGPGTARHRSPSQTRRGRPGPRRSQGRHATLSPRTRRDRGHRVVSTSRWHGHHRGGSSGVGRGWAAHGAAGTREPVER